MRSTGENGSRGSKFSTLRDRFGDLASLSVFLFTSYVMLIWVLSPKLLAPSASVMKFNTALGLWCASVSLWFQRRTSREALSSRSGRIGYFAALPVLLLGSLTSLEYFFGVDLGIDQSFVWDPPNPESQLHPGRMSPIAAICFVFLGMSLLSNRLDRYKRFKHIPSLMTVPVLWLSLLALVGYFYGASSLYRVGPFIRIAGQTAICFFFLGLGVLDSKRSHGFGASLRSNSAGGLMLRWMLPTAVFVPIIMGWARLQIEYAGYLDLRSGVASLTVSLITVLTAFVLFSAQRLDLSEKSRKSSENRAMEGESDSRRSEARFRGMFDSSMFGLIFWNEKGEIFDANDEFLRLVGYSREELRSGMVDWRKMTPPEYELLDQNALQQFAERRKCDPYEKEYFHKNGTRIPILVGGVTLSEVTGIGGVGFIIDNRAKSKIARELAESQETLRRALEADNSRLEAEIQARTRSIEEERQRTEELRFRLEFAASAAEMGIWEWNIRDNSLIWDERMYRLYGIQDRKGHEPYALWENGLHPLDKARAVSEIQSAIKNKQKFDTEFRVVHPSGEVRTIRAVASVIVGSNGEVERMIGVNSDITEQKLTQEELVSTREIAVSASKMKSDFLANMSHEIRTPINGVVGMMGLLADTQLSDQQREYVAAAKASTEALLTVINDILDFSKVEAGKLEFEDIDFNLPHLLKDVAKIFSLQAHAKGVSFSVEIDSKIPRYVGGDPGRLRQILNNLLGNALKFTEKGEICVTIRSEGVDKQKCHLRVEVRDTGIGIPQGSITRMFQAFSQSDSSTTRRFGGTGLGLSICKQLVEKMNGTIGVESQEGKGSTFWFVICLRTAMAPASDAFTGAVGNFRNLSERRFRVLVAEDNSINQKIAVRVLEKMGLSADAVANGQEVLSAHRSISYDLILMDCQMPELDGYETTRIIRSDPSLPRSEIPIVAMTANAIRGDKERCLAAGMNDYVSKPVKTEELFLVLQRWLINKTNEAFLPEIQTTSAQAVNRVVLRDLFSLNDGDDQRVLNEVIEMWLKEAPVILEKIGIALKANDLSTVSSLAHQLKSTSGNLGILEVSKIASEIESAVIANESARAHELAPKLERAVSVALPELQDLSRDSKWRAA